MPPHFVTQPCGRVRLVEHFEVPNQVAEAEVEEKVIAEGDRLRLKIQSAAGLLLRNFL